MTAPAYRLKTSAYPSCWLFDNKPVLCLEGLMTPKREYGPAGQEGLHQDDEIVGDSVDPIYDALRSEELVDTFQKCLAEAELDAESFSGTCNRSVAHQTALKSRSPSLCLPNTRNGHVTTCRFTYIYSEYSRVRD